jgi:DNA-binding MarR family transcriptional regulator
MPPPRPTADSVLEVTPLVMRVIRKEFRSQRGPGFTVPEFRSLAFVNRSPGASLNEVADHLGLEPPTASKLVETLVQRGLVRREEDPDDRRRVRLNILPKGKVAIDKAYEHTRLFLVRRLAHLSDEERKTVLRSMELLKHAFAGEPIVAAKETQNA